jgi:hypothetical protein
MLRTGTSALQSANKKHEVSSVWSLEYYATTEILSFKDSGNDLLHSRYAKNQKVSSAKNVAFYSIQGCDTKYCT